MTVVIWILLTQKSGKSQNSKHGYKGLEILVLLWVILVYNEVWKVAKVHLRVISES